VLKGGEDEREGLGGGEACVVRVSDGALALPAGFAARRPSEDR